MYPELSKSTNLEQFLFIIHESRDVITFPSCMVERDNGNNTLGLCGIFSKSFKVVGSLMIPFFRMSCEVDKP